LIFSFSGARKTDGETITYVFFDLVHHRLWEPESRLKDSHRGGVDGFGPKTMVTPFQPEMPMSSKKGKTDTALVFRSFNRRDWHP
jgi:hypothetical protein